MDTVDLRFPESGATMTQPASVGPYFVARGWEVADFAAEAAVAAAQVAAEMAAAALAAAAALVAGTVKEILAAVDGDPAKAAAALEAEQAQPSPRSTLIGELTDIVNGRPAPADGLPAAEAAEQADGGESATTTGLT